MRQLEVLATAARGDVDDPRAGVQGHVVPGDDPMLDVAARPELVERATVAPPDKLCAFQHLREGLVGEERNRHPVAGLEQAVLRTGVDRGGDVGRQRPGSRRPHDDGLALTVEQREANGQRRVGALLVAPVQLMGGHRGSATGTPLGRAVAEVEPALLVDDPQEAPDVLDVRVAEREVVVPPVHPLAEPDRSLRQLLGRPHDHVPALPGEAVEPVLLDLLLRVEPELAFDAHLDPEPLAVEPVLVALVVAAERLVALEDVLERAPPGGVHRQRLVRGYRAVEEAEPRARRRSACGAPRTSARAPSSSRMSSSSASWSGFSGRGLNTPRL